MVDSAEGAWRWKHLRGPDNSVMLLDELRRYHSSHALGGFTDDFLIIRSSLCLYVTLQSWISLKMHTFKLYLLKKLRINFILINMKQTTPYITI